MAYFQTFHTHPILLLLHFRYLFGQQLHLLFFYFQTKNLIKCPHIFEGANNEKILSILSNYFGCKFKLDWVWAWWSFPSNEKAGPQLFHRDYESFNFIKLFFGIFKPEISAIISKASINDFPSKFLINEITSPCAPQPKQ